MRRSFPVHPEVAAAREALFLAWRKQDGSFEAAGQHLAALVEKHHPRGSRPAAQIHDQDPETMRLWISRKRREEQEERYRLIEKTPERFSKRQLGQLRRRLAEQRQKQNEGASA